MVSRRTLEFLVGVVAAATVAGGLSLSVATPYALAAGATLVVSLVAAYVAVTNGYDGPIAAAGVAALGVFAGQAAFYVRTSEYVE